MILKFNKPITIEEAREQFSDCVKFVTSVDDYPNIQAVEFTCDPQLIFKREALDPKVTKQSNKIINNYKSNVSNLWRNTFNEIVEIAAKVEKQTKIDISREQRKKIHSAIDKLKSELSKEAKQRFEEGFKLGKIRGQIVSRQEIDDDLTSDDEKLIEQKLDDNLDYLAAFSNDLKRDIDTVLIEGPFESVEELENLIRDEVEETKKSRALMYPLAVLGLVAAGTISSVIKADEEKGEVKFAGGFWTLHPEEGLGGEVCEGCLENSGKWFDLEDFLNEYQTNNCLTNCRCDLRFFTTKVAP